jgi:hypothetical protein
MHRGSVLLVVQITFFLSSEKELGFLVFDGVLGLSLGEQWWGALSISSPCRDTTPDTFRVADCHSIEELVSALWGAGTLPLSVMVGNTRLL